MITNITRYLFFTGKGGVGKTSAACATALSLADAGRRVLLVSTDPASNLDDVLEAKIGQEPTEVPGATGLWALNLDPEEAAKAYRERVIGPYRGILPENAIASMEEQLAGACTMEIATFQLFTSFLEDSEQVAGFDHIVFDTAPTGHTLRLLALPRAWSGFLNTSTTGASCIGPLAGLAKQKERFENAVSVLANGDLTTLVLVARPEPPALIEAARASRELGQLGLNNQQLLINGILETNNQDRAAEIFRSQQRQAMARMPAELAKLPRRTAPLLATPPLGLTGLRFLGRRLNDEAAGNPSLSATFAAGADAWSIRTDHVGIPMGLGPIIDDLEGQERGVVLVMGKGGVGKTTVAAALALALAERGHRVHLSTTDPAAHLDLALAGAEKEAEGGFSVSHIDQAEERGGGKISPRGHGHGRRRSGRRGPRVVGRRLGLSLYRRDRRLPGLCADRRLR